MTEIEAIELIKTTIDITNSGYQVVVLSREPMDRYCDDIINIAVILKDENISPDLIKNLKGLYTDGTGIKYLGTERSIERLEYEIIKIEVEIRHGN